MTEHQQKEYKRVWKDEWLKTLCAFANAQGGTLVIGCDDHGNPVGLDRPGKLLEDIPNKARDVLGIMVDVNLGTDGETLAVCVEPYSTPISYKGEYFYRSGSTTQALKGAALDRFLMRKLGVHWDGVPVPGFSLEDLSEDALQHFRERAAESKRIPASDLALKNRPLLEKLKLLKDGYLKNAAILLFHADPEKAVTGAFVKIGYFRSETDLRFQDEVHGDLFTQVDRAMDFLLTKYTQALISYRGVQRVERFPVPEEALREALHNALVHREYTVPVPVQIRVYANKIRIWNPGHLPEDWTVENLVGPHFSHPGNPDIANAFFRAGLIEAWGRGMEKIFEACTAAENPKPRIVTEPGGLWLEFPFAIEQASGGPNGGQMGGQIELTGRQNDLIGLIRADKRMSRKTLADQLGINQSAVQKLLEALKKKGVLKRIGGTRGHWEVVSQNGKQL
ncbi:MAG TPA: transcriptional regulator [Verrucomicrobia bacterium]|nr:transcriptional regulator [Verrucomicrobiota bacterium]